MEAVARLRVKGQGAGPLVVSLWLLRRPGLHEDSGIHATTVEVSTMWSQSLIY